jgi:hypothetical protein
MQPMGMQPMGMGQPVMGVPMQAPPGMTMAMPPQGFPQQAVPILSTVPWINVMDRNQLFDGVTMKQTTKGCCRFGPCQPNMEWTVHEYTHAYGEGDAIDDKLYILEDAGYCGRCMSCCFPGGRATRYNVYPGGVPASAPKEEDRIFYYEKGCTNGVTQVIGIDNNGRLIHCPCCCYLPYLSAYEAQGKGGGKFLGKTQYICDMCLAVPKFAVEDTEGRVRYFIRPETCCCGACVAFECGGQKGRCCHVPFHIRDAVRREKIPPQNPQSEAAEITQLWSGVKECCNRENYAVNFPQTATQEDKIIIMGGVLLIDMALFEQGQ